MVVIFLWDYNYTYDSYKDYVSCYNSEKMFEWFFACFRPTEGCMALTWCYICCKDCADARQYNAIVERIDRLHPTGVRPYNS